MQKVIGLVGYVNKTEYIINLAKVISITGKSVLVIDGTLEERMRYSIPAFNNSEKEYLVHFDGVDYALGFRSIEAIKEYICKKTSNADSYDIILIDIDNVKSYEDFRQENLTKTFFFIEYLNISLAKDEELLKVITSYEAVDRKPVLSRVIFKQYVTRASEKYFENKILSYPIEWNEVEYELPYLDQDRIADIEAEQSGYIDMNRHTKQYITLVTDMASDILGELQAGDIRKMVKMYTRGRDNIKSGFWG